MDSLTEPINSLYTFPCTTIHYYHIKKAAALRYRHLSVGRPLDTSLYQQGFQPLRQNLLFKFRTVEQHGEGVKTKPLTISYYTHTL